MVVWVIELALLNLEGAAPVPNLPGPVGGSFVDVYINPGGNVQEVIVKTNFHTAFTWEADLLQEVDRNELWVAIQLMWGPNEHAFRDHGYPADGFHSNPQSSMVRDMIVDAIAAINTSGATAIAPVGALRGLMPVPVAANRVIPGMNRLASIIDRIAHAREQQHLLDDAMDAAFFAIWTCLLVFHMVSMRKSMLILVTLTWDAYRATTCFTRRDISETGENNFGAFFAMASGTNINTIFRVIEKATPEDVGEAIGVAKAILGSVGQLAELKLGVTTTALYYFNGSAAAGAMYSRNVEQGLRVGQVVNTTMTPSDRRSI